MRVGNLRLVVPTVFLVLMGGVLLAAGAGGNPVPPAPAVPVTEQASTPVPPTAGAVAATSTPAAAKPLGQPTPRPTAAEAPAGSAESPDVMITGQAKEVSASARVITFAEPVHGFESVALAEGAEIVGADGSPRTLQDIKPGMVIQASGSAGGSGSVLARKIRILTGPSPLPQ